MVLQISLSPSVGKGRQRGKSQLADEVLSGEDGAEGKKRKSLPSALDQGMAEDDISRMQGAAEKERWHKHGRG